jgi:histidinol-phosphate phosphatase family protein
MKFRKEFLTEESKSIRDIDGTAVFIDRDGTICKDVHYMSSPDQLELLPGVVEGISLLNSLGLKVIIVTNQSGIARGYFTEEALNEIHQKMLKMLSEEGARIDGIYYCPHHPNEGCECRKPKIGLLLKAAQDFKLDLKNCFMIGDKCIDVQAGRNAGCTTILIPSTETEKEIIPQPDYIAANFYEAAKIIERLLKESNLI